MVSGKLFNYDLPAISADEWHAREARRVATLAAELERHKDKGEEERRERTQKGIVRGRRKKWKRVPVHRDAR